MSEVAETHEFTLHSTKSFEGRCTFHVQNFPIRLCNQPREAAVHQTERNSEMSHADRHFLDVDFEVARSIHRIVRAMHDGECPRCHRLFQSKSVVVGKGSYSFAADPQEDEECPNCGFRITRAEMIAALKLFGPVMERNLEMFETWRKSLKESDQ